MRKTDAQRAVDRLMEKATTYKSAYDRNWWAELREGYAGTIRCCGTNRAAALANLRDSLTRDIEETR